MKSTIATGNYIGYSCKPIMQIVYHANCPLFCCCIPCKGFYLEKKSVALSHLFHINRTTMSFKLFHIFLVMKIKIHRK